MIRELDQKVLEYLRKQEWPSTTEDVAKGMNISWATANMALLRLMADKKIKFRRVGRQNQWWLEPNYRKEFGKKE